MEEEQDHQPCQERAKRALNCEPANGILHIGGLIELEADFNVFRNQRLHSWQFCLDTVHHVQRGGIGTLCDGDVYSPTSIDEGVPGQDVAAVLDCSNVTQEYGRSCSCSDRQTAKFLDLRHDRVQRCQTINIAGSDISCGQDRIARRHCFNHFVRRHVVCAQSVWINADNHCSLVTAEGRWSRDPWQGGKHWSHPEVLDFSYAPRLAGKDKVANRNTAGVEAHNERGDRPRRHKGTGPLYVRDRLRQGLTHISAGMKVEFDQADVLDGFRFDVLNARDVEEMVFIIRDEVPLHLGRIHPTIGLRYVNHRKLEIRKNIHWHTHEREN